MLGRWIPVYASIYDGGKLRALRKQLDNSEPECVGLLNALWDWGQLNADESGLLLNADEHDVATAIAAKMTGCKIDPLKVVLAMIETGWIERAEDGSLAIHDWKEWQGPWTQLVSRRKYDQARKRGKNGIEDYQPDPDGKPGSKPASNDGYSSDFMDFWSAYPRKIDKGGAYEKYKARLKDGFSPDELFAAAKAYAAKCKKERTEMKYIKHPRTFLGHTLPFQDYIPKTEPKKTSAGENPFAQYGKEV